MNDTLVGFALNIVACFAFGFMFVPLRNFDGKDGFFVQWVYSIAVFLIGFIVNCFRGFPTLEPLAMVGGSVSAVGSMAAVPLMKHLGLSIGMMLWGDIQVITGWSIARFGLLGTKPQPVYNNVMNVSGVLIVIFSGIMFAFVKHETQKKELVTKQALIANEKGSDEIGSVEHNAIKMSNLSINYKRSYRVVPLKEETRVVDFPLIKLFYVGLAVVIGVSHGFNMTPITYIVENYPNASHDVILVLHFSSLFGIEATVGLKKAIVFAVLDHIFAHYSAVTICTTVIFIGYCIVKRNNPYIKPELVLPSFAYGILWGGGMVLFFIANRLLSQTVSYPITMRLPSTITLMADLLLFKTVKGTKNVVYTIVAVSLGIFGILLIAFSNQNL